MGWLSKIFSGPTRSSKVVDYMGPDYRDPGMWDVLAGKWPRKWKDSSKIFCPPTFAEMERAYDHPIIGSCVDAIASAMSEARLDVGKEDGNGDFKSLDNHRLLDVMKMPNDFMSWTDLIRQWVLNSETTGYGYIWKIRGKGMSQVRQLIPLPTSWVTPHRARYGGIVDYFTVKGNDKVPVEDMIMYRRPSPNDLLDAGAPLKKCWRDYTLDRKREAFMVELLENMKVPGLIVTKKGGFGSPKRRAAAERELDDQLGDIAGRNGNTLLLEGDVDVKYQTPLSDLDWPGFSSITESRICTSFGVPAIIIGCRYGMDRSTYSNMSQAEKALYTRTCRPKWVAMADCLTRGLIMAEKEDPKLKFKFAFEELPQFQEDETELTSRVAMQYGVGLISQEEGREELGFTGRNPDDTEQSASASNTPPQEQQLDENGNPIPPKQPPAPGSAASVGKVKEGVELVLAIKQLHELKTN